jgi:hypothetical protein
VESLSETERGSGGFGSSGRWTTRRRHCKVSRWQYGFRRYVHYKFFWW